MTLSTGSGEVEAAGGERSPAAATLGQQTSGQAASPAADLAAKWAGSVTWQRHLLLTWQQSFQWLASNMWGLTLPAPDVVLKQSHCAVPRVQQHMHVWSGCGPSAQSVDFCWLADAATTPTLTAVATCHTPQA
jgi:hypothetical protein